MLGVGYVILLWHSLSLPYNYMAFEKANTLIINSLTSETNIAIIDLSTWIVVIDIKLPELLVCTKRNANITYFNKLVTFKDDHFKLTCYLDWYVPYQ